MWFSAPNTMGTSTRCSSNWLSDAEQSSAPVPVEPRVAAGRAT